MENRPLISVIMGIYNCADTLDAAVNCITTQTYDNWELIMCDDGSGDDTYQKALDIAKDDPRITVLKNEHNITLAPTLNKCLAVAKGEFIARMDGDDVCDPSRFEKELEILQNNLEYAIVSCYMNLADANGVFRTVKYPEHPEMKDFVERSMFCHAAVMVRTDAIRSVGGYSESPKRKRVEDYDLWIRMYAAGFKGYNIQEALYTMTDDVSAYKRRDFSTRLNGCRVKLKACTYSGAGITGCLKSFIPILKWFVPSFVYKKIHRGRQ